MYIGRTKEQQTDHGTQIHNRHMLIQIWGCWFAMVSAGSINMLRFVLRRFIENEQGLIDTRDPIYRLSVI